MVVLVLSMLVDPDLPESLIAKDQGAHFTHLSLRRVSVRGLPLPHVHIAIKGTRRDHVQLLRVGDPVYGISVSTPFVCELDIVSLEFNFCWFEH